MSRQRHLAMGSGPGPPSTADEKNLFSRMAEVYAGFSEYTDSQVGRIVEFLEQDESTRQHADLLLRG
jgi:arylsulfatase A-like enzyme